MDEANGNKINPTMDLKTTSTSTSSKYNEDDSASISEYTDPENNSAPTELLAEFLTSIMKREWKNALKHCKMSKSLSLWGLCMNCVMKSFPHKFFSSSM